MKVCGWKKALPTLMVLTVLLFRVLVLYAQTGQTSTVRITTKGVASILYDDIASARDQAIDDALRRAVQEALGTHIQSQTLVQNYQLVEDNILSWSQGYVSNYSVTNEMRTQYNTYEVVIEAVVDLMNLQNDEANLRQLLRKVGNPRVLVLIDEQNLHTYNRWYYFSVDMTAAETAMIEIFRQKGFDVLDPSFVKANQERDRILAAMSGDSQTAAAIATGMGSEIIITGKAIVKKVSGFNMGGMKSFQANVTARVIMADVASILATGSEHAAFPHIDDITGGTKAIEKAARRLAEKLANKITQDFQKAFYNQRTVRLTITGFRGYGELSAFLSKVRYLLRGVKEIQQREVSGDRAQIDLKMTGNAQQLAREFAHKDFSPFKPRILGLSQNKLNLELQQSTAIDSTR